MFKLPRKRLVLENKIDDVAGPSSIDELSKDFIGNGEFESNENGLSMQNMNHLSLLEGYKDGDIKNLLNN